MKKLIIILVIIFVVAAILTAANYIYKIINIEEIPVPPITEISTIDDIVKSYLENEKTKGLSIGTYKDGTIQFYNYGICADENPVKPTEHSIYEIGSITKTFTTAVLAQMVAEGLVKYDDPILKFLPSDIINWTADKSITLEELATHSSGLPRLPSNLMAKMWKSMDNPYRDYTEADMYDYLKSYKSKAKDKRKVEYSNLGMGLLGHILAKRDSTTYEAMLTKRIFQPLAMNESMIEMDRKQMIQGHDASGAPTSHWDLPALAGAGAVRSTTNDMLKYIAANIKGENAFADTHKTRKNFTDFQKIGLAWISQKMKDNNQEILWHNGGTGGFRTFLGFSKANKTGVIVLSNTARGVDMIGIRTLELLLKE